MLLPCEKELLYRNSAHMVGALGPSSLTSPHPHPNWRTYVENRVTPTNSSFPSNPFSLFHSTAALSLV